MILESGGVKSLVGYLHGNDDACFLVLSIVEEAVGFDFGFQAKLILKKDLECLEICANFCFRGLCLTVKQN